jgi:hypothetical protein
MTAQVQFMITNAMKATLVDELEFKPEEVDVMRPEIAAELIEKNMKRPFGDRPMPDQWKRDYDGAGGGGPARRVGLGPVGDLFRSLFYMTLVAGFCLGVACGASPVVRKEVKKTYKEVKRDVKRVMRGQKPKKRKPGNGSAVRSTAGRGGPSK